MLPPPNNARSDSRAQLGLLVICILLRVASLWHFRADLDADPDDYLRYARNIAAGHGLSDPILSLLSINGTRYVATAFRPPLYPILLAPVSGLDQQLGRAALHLCLAVITYLAIWRTGRNLGLTSRQTLLANAIYTVDPLALRYIAFPMTETLCAALVTVLMCLLTRQRRHIASSFAAGLVFGLCVLARPTFWVFGLLYSPVWLLVQFARKRKEHSSLSDPTAVAGPASIGSKPYSALLWNCVVALCGVAIPVLPWVQRNALYLHSPILMTTHGGYTMLLGNNEAFYREVVDQPWGTIWDGSHGSGQDAWVKQVLLEASPETKLQEISLDRWMSRKAIQTIQSEPGTFLRACVLKFVWFWNIGPHGPEAGATHPAILWGVRLFYIAFWTALVIGLIRIGVGFWRNFPSLLGWLPLVLMVFSLSAAHLVYWSDARMRAPITPVLALIAAYSFTRKTNPISLDQR